MNVTKQAQKLAAAYLEKTAEDEAEPTGTEVVGTGRLVDLACLAVAYDAFYVALGARDQKSPLLSKGLVLIKRYSDELANAIQQHLVNLSDRPDAASLRDEFRIALRQGTPHDVARSQSTLFKALFPWLKMRPQLFNGLFAGRVAKAARELAAIVEEASPEGILNKISTITPVSGMTAHRKWVELAAAEVGAPIKPVESVMVDAQVARGLGEDLARVEAKIPTARPGTPEAADLQAERLQLVDQIEKVAERSGDRSAILAVAAASKPTHQFATETGKKLGHTPDQEKAMMVRGRALIAAGAGSGKTRVLASKVVFHIQEQGIDPTAILATSFTGKAAAELVKRVRDYGAVIEGAATDNFGTTHSICGKFLNRKAQSFRRPAYIGKGEGWKQNTILRLAMEQVKMLVSGAPLPPHKPKGIWEGRFVDDMKTVNAPPGATVTPSGQDMTFINSVDTAIGYFQWASRTWSGGPGDWARQQVPFLQDMRAADPRRLSPKQREWLNRLFEKVKGRSLITYRVAAYTGPVLAAEAEGEDLPSPKNKRSKLDDYTYYKNPARQWFNLGRKLTRKTKDAESAIPMGEFKNAISILKGRGLSPSEAWHGAGPYEAESDHAAVYAAYEWIKGSTGETEFASHGDMDDILIDTVTALVGSPGLRQQMQAQFKVLLIDEAQDLNKVQHLIFGLIAGYLDPDTLQPKANKAMTADTFALIGDDKQAIYEFRGADPEEFIDKSDLVTGGDDFKTVLLDMNFRSGEAIVNAANKLIAHNRKQVPMVCKANIDRNGQGKIVTRRTGSVEDAAVSVAEEIAGLMEAAEAGASKYKDFGLAVRSNAEAYQYGLEMLKRGIPFKSNAKFFSDNNTKAMIGWLTIAEKGLDGDKDSIENAIRDAVKAPYSRLGPAFFQALMDRSTGPWAKWLVGGGWKSIYSRAEMQDTVKLFVDNLKAVAEMKGSPSDIVNQLMNLKGLDGKTMREAMIQSVEENDDLMAELAAEAEGGQVSVEQIIEQALAPVEPLLGLLRGKEDLGSAMDFVRKLRAVNEKITTQDSDKEIDRDAVTIGTMHSWKGLEVPTMYVPMVGSKFPQAGPEGVAVEGPALASERRLAYVAITRAEQRCVILSIPHPKLGTTSQFISEACVPFEGADPTKGAVPKMASDLAWDDQDIEELQIGDPDAEDTLITDWEGN